MGGGGLPRLGGGVGGWRAAGQREVPRMAVLSLQLGDRLPPGRAGVPGARAGPGGTSAAPVPAAAAARRVPGTAEWGGKGWEGQPGTCLLGLYGLFAYALKKKKFIYFFIFGCAGSLLVRLFSSCGEQGLLSTCGAPASHCSGFSCYRAQAVECQLSSCGSQD